MASNEKSQFYTKILELNAFVLEKEIALIDVLSRLLKETNFNTQKDALTISISVKQIRLEVQKLEALYTSDKQSSQPAITSTEKSIANDEKLLKLFK